MHRLCRRSVSAALCARATRYRSAAVAPISSSTPVPDSAVVSDNNTRWYSVIAGGKCDTARNSTHLNLKSGLFFGSRHESTAAASDSANPPAPPAEKYEYQAEVSRLMDLIVNSLYSNKEVFLRELISNASDALDKWRYLSVTDSQLLKDAVDLSIRIQTDKDNGIISITDSGIGMTRQELVDCLGTIAQSETAKFLMFYVIILGLCV